MEYDTNLENYVESLLRFLEHHYDADRHCPQYAFALTISYALSMTHANTELDDMIEMLAHLRNDIDRVTNDLICEKVQRINDGLE